MNENKKFWIGLGAGIAFTLMVCFGALLVFQTVYQPGYPGNEVTDEGTSGTESGKDEESADSSAGGEDGSAGENVPGLNGEVNWDRVQIKSEVLSTLLDTYYLNDFDADEVEEGLYKGLVKSLGDPYSVYYTAEEYADFMESTAGKYCGIGVLVSQNVSNGVITVVRTFKNGSGYEQGILPGDIIYKIGDEEVRGIDLSKVVTKIKGEEGTSVNVTVYRESDKEYHSFDLERRQIEVDTVEYEMLENQIGYISIMEFDEVTADQFRFALSDLEAQGMKGLVVDLRNNPGGLLDVVCDMLDRLLPEGLIVYTEDKYGKREENFSTDAEFFDQPLVVLVNGQSASASEIFAGAVQDYGIGTILGTQTFGKGIVQTLLPLTDGTAMKVTISKYYTPKGRNIHGVGITPDVELELADELKKMQSIPKDQDNQLQKALELIQEEMK